LYHRAVTTERGERLRRWLAAAEVDAPRAVAAARRALERGAHMVTAPHGSVICYGDDLPLRRRRLIEFDPNGVVLAAFVWDDDALTSARVRLPDRSWIAIEPRATTEAPWGMSDCLRHDAGAETVAEALDWTRVDRIPTVLEPARLPSGAGTAVLNVIAGLAADQQRTSLRYHGPYPTEQLFLALLESFRYAPASDDPPAAFAAGALAWHPAPHERHFAGADVVVQARDRVEKIVWRGRAYYREDWQGIRRRAPRRLVDRAGGVSAVLWALGAPVEEHLRLPGDGPPVLLPLPSVTDPPSRPLAPAVAEGALAIVAATGAPPLAPFVRAAGGKLTLAWEPMAGNLFVWRGARVAVSYLFRERLIARLREAPDRAARAGVALIALTEIAALLGDELRARAQARLATLPSAQQAAALATEIPAATDGDAARIAAAVDALMHEAASR
jgi:hypothetical protein